LRRLRLESDGKRLGAKDNCQRCEKESRQYEVAVCIHDVPLKSSSDILGDGFSPQDFARNAEGSSD
jgi:hypothetical protein